MNYQDVILNRSFSNNEVCAGFSAIFHIQFSEILAVKEIPTDIVPESTRILCQVQDIEGDFKQLISVYVRDHSVSTFSFEENLGRFCDIYSCSCLISNTSKNPYSMTLVKGLNSYETVYLSSELLDAGQYVLLKKA